jgi:alkylation response protein AidB-like acyl-CoA dehydrogenase
MSSNDETAEGNDAADTSPNALTSTPAERTRTLELALGDAWNTGGSISFRSLVDAAEAEQLLGAAVAVLDRCAFDTEFVPADLGGRLTSLDGLGQLVRPVSRRDIALVMACGLLSFGAASAVWVAGAGGQRLRLADSLLSGGQLAVSCLDAVEDIAGRGSDEGDLVRIEDGPDGPLGNGALVVVNESVRAELLVATISEPSAGADSLFLIDRSRLGTGQIAVTNEVADAGSRAIELIELWLTDVPLPATDLIGAQGSAAEVRRAAEVLGYAAYCSALIGMADTALRVVARSIVRPPAASRSSVNDVQADLDGRTRIEAEMVQHADELALTSSFIDLLVADALSVAASRAAHLLPQECQLISAVTSYLVPKLLGESLYRLSVDLGYHVRVDAVANRMFSKTVNDVAAFTFGHVTAARYATIAASQLPRAAAGSWSGTPAAPPELFRPGAELPMLDAGQLTAAGGRDGIFSHLDLILRDLPAASWQADDTGPLVRTFCEQLQREIGELVPARLDGTDRIPAVESDPGMPPAAERYALALAGAVCVGIWAQARGTGSFVAGSGWLAAALHSLLTRMDSPTWDLPPELSRSLTAEVLLRTREHISYDLYESELA